MKKITFCAALLSSVCCLPLLNAMDGLNENSASREDTLDSLTIISASITEAKKLVDECDRNKDSNDENKKLLGKKKEKN